MSSEIAPSELFSNVDHHEDFWGKRKSKTTTTHPIANKYLSGWASISRSILKVSNLKHEGGSAVAKMSAVDYLLHESSVGYAIFQVIHQADTIGNRLKEVQDASQDLAKFGKMIKLVNFAPYR